MKVSETQLFVPKANLHWLATLLVTFLFLFSGSAYSPPSPVAKATTTELRGPSQKVSRIFSLRQAAALLHTLLPHPFSTDWVQAILTYNTALFIKIDFRASDYLRSIKPSVNRLLLRRMIPSYSGSTVS